METGDGRHRPVETVHFQMHLQGGVVEAERLPYQGVEGPTPGQPRAEVDLELRGEGTILGTRQKGMTDLKLASLRRDKELVRLAREVAFDIVDGDPGLDPLPRPGPARE